MLHNDHTFGWSRAKRKLALTMIRDCLEDLLIKRETYNEYWPNLQTCTYVVSQLGAYDLFWSDSSDAIHEVMRQLFDAAGFDDWAFPYWDEEIRVTHSMNQPWYGQSGRIREAGAQELIDFIDQGLTT